MNRIASSAATSLVALALAAATPGLAHGTQKATPVTVRNLPAASQLKVYDMKVESLQTLKGHHKLYTNQCQTKHWSDFKPNAEFTRFFGFTDAHTKAWSGYGGASIASFRTHAAAVKAADQMFAGFACAKHLTQERIPGLKVISLRNRTLALRGGVKLHVTDVRYAYAGQHYFWDEQVAVMAVGTHAEVLDHTIPTQDGDPQIIVRNAQRALPTLAR